MSEGEEAKGTEAEPASRRSRLVVAIVLGAGLVAGILIAVLAGGGGGDAATADAACIEDWNADETMVAFGQHQFSGHGYERVQVLRVTDAGVPIDSESGMCAVVFAARALDPEPGARAQVLLDGRWTGFESLTDPPGDDEIAALQADAFSQVNASLTTEGRLTATSG